MRRKAALAAMVAAGFVLCIEIGLRVWGWAALASRRSEAHPADLLIVCVGDSWTFGYGLPRESAYPAQLERRLHDSYGVDARVANLGKPGSTSKEALDRLASFLAMEHPLVILWLAGQNPTVDAMPSDPTDVARLGPLVPVRTAIRHLASYRLLVQLVARASAHRAPMGEGPGMPVVAGAGEMRRPPPVPGRRAPVLPPEGDGGWLGASEWPGWEWRTSDIRGTLGSADAMAAAHGADLYVLTYGLPTAIEPMRGEPWLPYWEVNTIIREAASSLDRPVIDVEQAWSERRAGVENLLHGAAYLSPPRVDLHPNERGYAIYAEVVAQELMERR